MGDKMKQSGVQPILGQAAAHSVQPSLWPKRAFTTIANEEGTHLQTNSHWWGQRSTMQIKHSVICSWAHFAKYPGWDTGVGGLEVIVSISFMVEYTGVCRCRSYSNYSDGIPGTDRSVQVLSPLIMLRGSPVSSGAIRLTSKYLVSHRRPVYPRKSRDCR